MSAKEISYTTWIQYKFFLQYSFNVISFQYYLLYLAPIYALYRDCDSIKVKSLNACHLFGIQYTSLIYI